MNPARASTPAVVILLSLLSSSGHAQGAREAPKRRAPTSVNVPALPSLAQPLAPLRLTLSAETSRAIAPIALQDGPRAAELPLAELEAQPAPAVKRPESILGKLAATFKELKFAGESDRRRPLDALFSNGAPGRSPTFAAGTPGEKPVRLAAARKKEALSVLRRVRSYRGKVNAESRLELVPYLDSLWASGLLTASDVGGWSEEVVLAGLRATRRRDVFEVLAGGMSPEKWGVPQLKSADSLRWAWRLTGFKDKAVSLQLAAHETAPPDLLEELAGHPDPDVRSWAAYHPSTPARALARLSADQELSRAGRPVADYVPLSPDEMRRSCVPGDHNSKAWAVYKHTPGDVLAALADYFPAEVAKHPSAPAETLRVLAASPDDDVRAAAAGNPSTPAETLAALAKDRSQKVKAARAANPVFPRDALGRLLSEYPSPPLGEPELRQLVEEHDAAIRFNRILLSKPLRKLGVTGDESSPSLDRAETALANLWDGRQARGLTPFRRILIDVRGSRGGRGDVAAGYLTATDVLTQAKAAEESLASAPQVTLLMDQASERILGGLRNKPIEAGDSDFGGRLVYHDIRSLPASPAMDLYIAPARPSGRLENEKDLRRVEPPSTLRRLLDSLRAWERLGVIRARPAHQMGIPIDGKTVLMVQTVLGNTENQDSRQPFALVKVGDRDLTMLPAGLSTRETGVYSDHVAWSLRDKAEGEVRRTLLASIRSMAAGTTKTKLSGILKGKWLAGSELGLVYGVTSSEVKGQFETYLKGLAAAAEAGHKSYTLVTPSGFALDDIEDERLRARIEIIEAGERLLTTRAEKGKIYVVKTSGLPHAVFVGLMAYSRPPPVVAGDGAMSAAIVLGRPFVMTRIAWNAANIDNFRERLLEKEQDPARRAILDAVYAEMDLTQALALKDFSAAFRSMVHEIPDFTSAALSAAHAAKNIQNLSVSIESVLPYWSSYQKAEILLERSRLGDKNAKARFSEHYRRLAETERKQIEAQALATDRLIRFKMLLLSAEFFFRNLLNFPAAAAPRTAPPPTPLDLDQ